MYVLVKQPGERIFSPERRLGPDGEAFCRLTWVCVLVVKTPQIQAMQERKPFSQVLHKGVERVDLVRL